jgi:hypothetical protein
MLIVKGRHPSVQHFKHHFDFDHLSPGLQPVSRPFHELAQRLVDALPDDPELTVALRKLWEAKNSAVLVALRRKDHRDD